MMAFFLLLWLLNAVTQEQLEGISDYFSPISTDSTTSGGAGLMAGEKVTNHGVFDTDAASPGAVVELPVSRDQGTDSESMTLDADEEVGPSSDDSARKLAHIEDQQFRKAEEQLRLAIEGAPQLKQLAKSLLVDNTPEGLRVQIIDQERLPMFPRGSAEMYLHTRKILELVAKVVQQMPQDIAISGHTDATKFAADNGYSNWELSADRANAARRALIKSGVPPERIARVVGKAATDPLLADEPEAPGNRRLTVVLLRGTGQQSKNVTGALESRVRVVSNGEDK
jgi:chemotaxis protein MotB